MEWKGVSDFFSGRKIATPLGRNKLSRSLFPARQTLTLVSGWLGTDSERIDLDFAFWNCLEIKALAACLSEESDSCTWS